MTCCGPSPPAGSLSWPCSPRSPSRPATAWPRRPTFEDAAVFRRGIGEESDVVGKEMYEFADRDGHCPRPAPGGHGLGRAGLPPAPSGAPLEGLVRDAGLPPRAAPGRPVPPAPPGRRSRSLGHRRPRRRRRGDLGGRPVLPHPRPRRLRALGQLHGRRHVPARLRRAARRVPARARRRAVRGPPTTASTPTPCGSSTASGPSAGAVTEAGAALRRPPVRRLRRPLRAGPDGARRPRDHGRARPPPGTRLRLLHPHDVRVRLGRDRGGPERDRRRWPLRRTGRGDGWPVDPGHRVRDRHRAGPARL